MNVTMGGSVALPSGLTHSDTICPSQVPWRFGRRKSNVNGHARQSQRSNTKTRAPATMHTTEYGAHSSRVALTVSVVTSRPSQTRPQTAIRAFTSTLLIEEVLPHLYEIRVDHVATPRLQGTKQLFPTAHLGHVVPV